MRTINSELANMMLVPAASLSQQEEIFAIRPHESADEIKRLVEAAKWRKRHLGGY